MFETTSQGNIGFTSLVSLVSAIINTHLCLFKNALGDKPIKSLGNYNLLQFLALLPTTVP
jgi:hypothetical protein